MFSSLVGCLENRKVDIMKKYAFFLPQFHEIRENNEWWGEGFTEWVNVKKATPLYENHLQPKKPLDENYYDLLEKDTVLWQTELMKKYKIDGLIYYHYYFEGRMLLEKPAENLLKWKEIPQNFFFCWANHTWNRSWNGTKEVLLEQTYGDEDAWEEHFQYLLPFFLDQRYEKRNNEPVFMIFDSNFSQKKDMFEYFNKRCLENGFSGICLIETYIHKNEFVDIGVLREKKTSQTEFLFYREPTMVRYDRKYQRVELVIRCIDKVKKIVGKAINKPFVKTYSGNELYELMIQDYVSQKDVLHGVFFEWDNTPRHKERGYIITPVDKVLFDQYMTILKEEEYVFINAWNEWAEGMMLEPTEENGYKYLEWLKEW